MVLYCLGIFLKRQSYIQFILHFIYYQFQKITHDPILFIHTVLLILSYLSSYSLFIEFDVEACGFSVLCMRTRVIAATSRFGSRSLQIHIRSCLAKYHQEQSLKDKNERRSLPAEPSLLAEILAGDLSNLASYNQQALQIHKYQVLPACSNCGRTFNEESFKIHVKTCVKKGNQPTKQVAKFQDDLKKPRTLVCCVCGREFGLLSLKIHYPQCVEKFKIEQLKKSKQQRRPTPLFSNEDIALFQQKTQWTLDELEEFNTRASAAFKQKAMIHCSTCGRNFNPQPYQKHLRNCKQNTKNPIQSPPQIAQYTQPKQIKKPKVLMCYICGRQFGLSSLVIHQKTCKEKFVINQKKKEKKSRRPLPSLPVQVQNKFKIQQAEQWPIEKIEEYNSICSSVYRNQSMIECSWCKRKFIEQAYEKHKNYCQKTHQGDTQGQKKQDSLLSKKKELPIKKKQEEPIKNQKQEIKFIQYIPQIQKKQQKQKQEKSRENKYEQQKIEQKILKQKESSPQKIEKKSPSFLKKQPDAQNSSKLSQTKKNIQPKRQIVNQAPRPSQKFKQIKVDNVIHQTAQQLQQTTVFQSIKMNPGPSIVEPLEQLTSNAQSQKSLQEQTKNLNNNINIQKNDSKLIQQSIQLIPCQKCGRKFMAERLAKHQTVCKGNKIALNFNNKQSSKQLDKQQPPKSSRAKQLPHKSNQVIEDILTHEGEQAPQAHHKQLVPCSKCGRRFLQNRVAKHQECCKGKQSNSSNSNQIKESSTLRQKAFEKPSIQNLQPKPPTIEKPRQKIIERNSKKKQASQLEQAPQTKYQQNDTSAQNQSTFQELELRQCSKCDRKFALDRLQIHQNACKGKTKPKIQLQEKMKTMDVIRKTKENFFKMVQQIRTKKVKQQEIDKQLQVQLQTLKENQPKPRQKIRKEDENQFIPNQKKVKDIQSESVNKWMKKQHQKTPQKERKKWQKGQSHLPKI